VNGELHRRDYVDALLATAAALIVYRLGLQIPIPGLEPNALPHLTHAGGAAAARTSIFALDIYPLFGILILAELIKVLAPSLRRWEHAEARNAAKLARVVFIIALFSAVLQAGGVASGLEGVSGLVAEPGVLFSLATIATLVAGTTIVTWLARQISVRGLGSGAWLIIAAPTLAELPHTIATLSEFQRQGIVSGTGVLWGAVFIVAAVAAVVAVLSAGGRPAGTAPACLWSTVLAYSALPWVVVSVSALEHLYWPGDSLQWIEQGHPVRLVALALLLWLFVGLYVRSCRMAGVAVPALPAAVLAAVLAAVALGCEALPTYLNVPLILSGQPLLVIAIVMMTLLRDWGKGPLAQGTREGDQSSAANR
jgi:preprotein translocase subunit SecY